MTHEAFGPYRTLDRLGEGAFGRVYLAEDTRRPGHLVALKVGAGPSERHTHAAAQLQKEGELLRRLQHPHIVAYEDFGIDTAQDAMWLAMEVLDGGSLRTIQEGRRQVGSPCPESFVRRVLLEVGSALQYIHSEGLLHRDVKPANILLTLTAPPVLKLADFGISKLLEDAAAHSIVGTQCYFAPELISGEPYASAADCWALGIVLFELASLLRPFSGSSMLELAMAICQQPTPPLPPLGPDLVEVINGLLEKDVDHRWQLQDALNHLITASQAAQLPAVDSEDCSISLSTQGGRPPEHELVPQDAQPGPPAVAFAHQPPAKGRKEWTSIRGWFSWWPFSKAADDRHETQVAAIAPAQSALATGTASRTIALETPQVESWDVQSLPGQASSFSTRQ